MGRHRWMPIQWERGPSVGWREALSHGWAPDLHMLKLRNAERFAVGGIHQNPKVWEESPSGHPQNKEWCQNGFFEAVDIEGAYLYDFINTTRSNITCVLGTNLPAYIFSFGDLGNSQDKGAVELKFTVGRGYNQRLIVMTSHQLLPMHLCT